MIETSNHRREHDWLHCASNTALLGDIHDPASYWYSLRIADLSGFDYVFIPDAVADCINDLPDLQNLAFGVQTLLGSELQRTILISYSEPPPHFSRYLIHWCDDQIQSCIVKNLDGEAQNEFIQTLFLHSGKLIQNSLSTRSQNSLTHA